MLHLLFRARSLAYLAALVALSTAGCGVHLGDRTPVEGEAEERKVAYKAGQNLRIETTGNIEVRRGEGSEIAVTFTPFALVHEDETEAEKAELRRRMEEELVFVAEASEDGVTVRVDGRDFGQRLGARISLSVPVAFSGDFDAEATIGAVDVELGGTAFAGDFTAKTERASIRANLRGTSPTSATITTTSAGPNDEDTEVVLLGAGGTLAIDAGDIAEVEVTDWSEGVAGSVEAEEIEFTFPTDASCDLLVSGASISAPDPLPESWTQGPDVDGAQYYLLGDGGELLQLTASSSVTLEVH